MKKFKNLKLSAKLILSVVVPAVFLLGLTQVYIGMKSYQNSKEDGIAEVTAKSNEIAAVVENYLNSSFETVKSIENTYVALQKSKNPSRENANEILQEILRNNKSYLAMWSMWEKNAFDGMDEAYLYNPKYSKTKGTFNISYYKDKNSILTEQADYNQYQDEYYVKPKENKINTIIEPYYYSYVHDTAHQVYETTLAVPIISNDKVLGVVGLDIELNQLQTIIAANKLFHSGFASIVTNKMQISAHPDKNLVNKSLFTVIKNDTDKVFKAIQTGQEYYVFDKSNDNVEVLRYFCPIHISGTKTPWSVMIEVPMSEVTEKAHNLIFLLLIINVLGMIVFTILIIYLSKSITKPIIEAADFVNCVSQGDLTKTIVVDQKDEIGVMTQNLQQMVNKLRLVVTDIVSGAENISLAGIELTSASQQLSEGSTEQAASTEEVSSSMEEMVSNINQNADNALQTQHISLQASVDIEEGSKAVFSTLEAMKKIAEKILIIGEIAEKTDLLAINAAIEAARAGEHGKGFAVVATEVRKLAERSQNAAKEIDELSKSSVKIADESGIVLKKIIPDIKKTATLVQEISAASMEQNSGANQINNAIMQLNTVTQRNATASEELSASAEELVNQSNSLKEFVSFFKTGYEVAETPSSSFEVKRTQTQKSASIPQKQKLNAIHPIHLSGSELKLNEVDKEYEKF